MGICAEAVEALRSGDQEPCALARIEVWSKLVQVISPVEAHPSGGDDDITRASTDTHVMASFSQEQPGTGWDKKGLNIKRRE